MYRYAPVLYGCGGGWGSVEERLLLLMLLGWRECGWRGEGEGGGRRLRERSAGATAEEELPRPADRAQPGVELF